MLVVGLNAPTNKIFQKFIVALEKENLAHVAGRDTYKPGPPPNIGLRDYTLHSDKIEIFSRKPFDAEPYVCPGCYARFRVIHHEYSYFQRNTVLQSQGGVLYTADQLSSMLEESLIDPQPVAKCECETDDQGKKKCGGKGIIFSL